MEVQVSEPLTLSGGSVRSLLILHFPARVPVLVLYRFCPNLGPEDSGQTYDDP